MRPASTPTIGGLPTKYVSLLVLVVQNSALVLTMRYSRIVPGPQYLSSTAVVTSELMKCVICLVVHLHQQHTRSCEPSLPLHSSEGAHPTITSYTIQQLIADIFSRQSGFLKLLVPAVLYTLQNNLQFVAATNLDAATFQVTYQCKILTTALFAVLLLRQSLSALKWLSLLLLTIGVACVQIPSSSTTSSIVQQGSATIGLFAVAIACVCSGFAGVYFEKVLKSSSLPLNNSSSTNNSTSLWVRNIQLSIGCLGIALIGTIVWDGAEIQEYGFFQGYRTITVLTICIQASGGLIVAMVIKYADNILKGFATSLSIILSTAVSVFVFDFVVTGYFLIGSLTVVAATYMYGMPEKKPSSELSGRIGVVEEHSAKGDEEEAAVPMLPVQDYDRDDTGIEREKTVRFADQVEQSGKDEARPQRQIYDELGYVD